MDNRDTIAGIVVAVYIVYRVFKGFKRLGIMQAFKESGLFMTKEASKNTVKPTLTEVFQASRTRFHVELIMYVLMLVLAVLTVMKVLPWGIAAVLTIIFEVIIAVPGSKNKDE